MTLVIRRYEPDDLEGVRAVHTAAFRRRDDPGALPIEVTLFDRLLARGDVVPELSIVAIDNERIIGHVVCSWARVGDRTVVGLGPIGVVPERQARRVGTSLMESVLSEADRLGFPLIALLGWPDYYRRFGFMPAASLGIDAPDPAWNEHFQAKPLSRYDPSIRGPFHYAPPFDEVAAT
jgi:putative acetyltransferase